MDKSPDNLEPSSTKRKIETVDVSNATAPKRTKPSEEQETPLISAPAKKRPAHLKPKLTVPHSPMLRTSSRIRDRQEAVKSVKEKTKTEKRTVGLPDISKSKTTVAISPKLSTKERATARKPKETKLAVKSKTKL